MANEEKVKFIHTLRKTLEGFVDLAYGIDAVQLAKSSDQSEFANADTDLVQFSATKTTKTISGEFKRIAVSDRVGKD